MDIQQAAIDAYLGGSDDVPDSVRAYGAALSFAGIADNGGLLGGGIENCRETETVQAIADAVTAFRVFGLEAIADLVEQADAEYVRTRPGGPSTALSAEDQKCWDAIDARWFALDATGRLDQLADSIRWDASMPTADDEAIR